jgi:hypothetical protein
MEISMCNNKLSPGVDYIVHPGSPSVAGTYVVSDTIKADTKDFVTLRLAHIQGREKKLVIDSILSHNENIMGLLIVDEKKLTWSVSQNQIRKPVIYYKDGVFDSDCRKISLDIDAELKKHLTSNLIGYIEGTKYPDKFIVLTGHYDHLGRMGANTFFPGANDNASGIAVMLAMARYYSQPQNKPECSIVFMAFAGEEAGLVGSEYYVNNPFFPLNKIKFLINLDLMGTGEEGITVVNGELHEAAFNSLDSLNKIGNYFPAVGKRGNASNSDHYYFSEQGVPAFFIYTMGPRKSYHDVYDVPETLKFPKILPALQLISSFIKTECDRLAP